MTQSLTAPGEGPNRPTPSRLIPVPDVPIRPVLSLGTFWGAHRSAFPCFLDRPHQYELTAGRMAIALALDMMELAPGAKILVPAYHCASMINPLARTKAAPAYYKVKADLSVDLEDIEAKMDPDTRALMVTHYFGFPQDMMPIRALCDRHGLVLIEDCAHCLFGSRQGIPIGSVGDYAIASLTKYFPVREGGALIAKEPPAMPIRLKSRRFADNLFEAYATLQESTYHRRLILVSPFIGGIQALKKWLDSAASGHRQGASPGQERSGMQGEIDWAWLHVRPSLASALTCRLASRDRLVQARRANYQRLSEGLSGLPGCRPLMADLPADTVPYMFPFWIDQLHDSFPVLEDRAVPMQRFGQFLSDGVDQSICPVSYEFSKHLVQFPCHQELTEREIDWLIATVRDTLAQA